MSPSDMNACLRGHGLQLYSRTEEDSVRDSPTDSWWGGALINCKGTLEE